MSTADVVIIGGGLAGLSVAAHLRDAAVVVLEATDALGGGNSALEDGLVRPGLLEHPGSLVEALGVAQAGAIYQLGLQILDQIEGMALLQRTGVVALAAGPGEDAASLTAGVAALAALGVPAEVWSAAPGGGLGRLEPQAGLVDPAALLAALAVQAEARGARIRRGAQVTAVLSEAGGSRVLGEGVEIQATLVVYAAGAGLCALDPFFGETVLPYRQSHVLAPGTLSVPVVAGHGLTRARPHPDGVLLSGARWATPHLEAWERDPTVVPPPIEAALLRFGRRLDPALGAPIRRWAGIQAHTCDGLPLVGPLPGRPTQIACAGWCGQDLALALGCGAGVAEGITTGRGVGVPACFGPGRML